MSGLPVHPQAKTRCIELNLVNNQVLGNYRWKNLWWVLHIPPPNKYAGAWQIGFGDLSEFSIQNIRGSLPMGWEFLGYNEHHGSKVQKWDEPVIRIYYEATVSYPRTEAVKAVIQRGSN